MYRLAIRRHHDNCSLRTDSRWPTYLLKLLSQQQAGPTPRSIKVDNCRLLHRAADDHFELLFVYMLDVAECCCCTDLEQGTVSMHAHVVTLQVGEFDKACQCC